MARLAHRLRLEGGGSRLTYNDTILRVRRRLSLRLRVGVGGLRFRLRLGGGVVGSVLGLWLGLGLAKRNLGVKAIIHGPG